MTAGAQGQSPNRRAALAGARRVLDPNGTLRVDVSSVLPLEQAAGALTTLATGSRGKVVITIGFSCV